MKKILHVTMSNAYGGAENIIFSIIDNLKEKNDFYYLCPEGNIGKMLNEKNIKYEFIKKKNFKQSIKNIKANIIHAHDFTASVLCALNSNKVCIISHLHTDHTWLKRVSIKSLIYLLASIKFKYIIVVSESMAKEMWFYKYIKNKTKVMINTIDIKEIKKLSEKEVLNEEYDIAFLGRLSEYKNPLRFIDIVTKVKEVKGNIKAILIGDGELKEECIRKIKDNKLENNILLKGFLENPFPFIKRSKVLVMPSKVEALGLSAVQAMSLGKPVIISNIGGLKDIVNKDNGRLCNDNEEFKENILEILDDKDLYNSLSIGAIKSCKKLSKIDDYMNELDKIYNN